jgi:hypothetical protein
MISLFAERQKIFCEFEFSAVESYWLTKEWIATAVYLK